MWTLSYRGVATCQVGPVPTGPLLLPIQSEPCGQISRSVHCNIAGPRAARSPNFVHQAPLSVDEIRIVAGCRVVELWLLSRHTEGVQDLTLIIWMIAWILVYTDETNIHFLSRCVSESDRSGNCLKTHTFASFWSGLSIFGEAIWRRFFSSESVHREWCEQCFLTPTASSVISRSVDHFSLRICRSWLPNEQPSLHHTQNQLGLPGFASSFRESLPSLKRFTNSNTCVRLR